LNSVSPIAFPNVSVAMARYKPFRRTDAPPTSALTGTVATAASGTASQKGHPHTATATPVVKAPMPTNVNGINEMSPA
jgi:hypothetical protein